MALNLERRSLVLQSRFGYREPGVGHLVFSAYGSGLERGGDFAHWAQLTNGTDASGRDVGTRIALGQFRLNLDGLLNVADGLTLAAQSTYFQGGILPPDRVEIASESFYVERKQAYRGVDSVFEARYMPTSRFNAIAGVETVYDREDLPAAERINRLTGQSVLVGQSAALGDHVNLVNVGAYGSVNYKLLDPWLKLTGGLRFDHHSQYGSQLTGRVGVTSRFSRSVVAKVLYGSAFKAPSPYLTYATPLRPGDVIGNSRLKPQYIHTVESQISFNPARFFGLTSGVSYSWLLDKAEFTPSGINETARNVASQQSLSWETRLDLRHYYDYNIYLSAEFVRSRRDLGQEGYAASLVGKQNVVYPPFMLRGGSMFAVPSLTAVPLQLGAEVTVVGPRRAADASIVERGEDFTLPAYVLLDITLASREIYLIPGHESRFALRSRNILAARGPDPGFSGFEYPLAPPGIFVELEHTY
jgi:iron complex outermembrane receptor protein